MKDLVEAAKSLTPSVFLIAGAILSFYIYSITGDLLYLGLTGVFIWSIFAVYLLGDAFKKWRDNRTDSAAKELGHFTSYLWTSLVSGHYRHSYFEFLRAKHSIFDVKGLSIQGAYSLDLEKVFVDLSIIPEPLSESNVLMPPQEFQEGRHDIWTYLNSPFHKHLAVIGIPGCGKTTLLKYITLTLTHRTWRNAKKLAETNPSSNPKRWRFALRRHRKTVEIPNKLPILLFLRDHAKSIHENAQITLTELIHQSVSIMPEMVVMPTGWFEKYLQDGRCIIMMDGLDEVGDPVLRHEVVAWVERVKQAHHKNRFIISSRPHGYHSNPIEGMTQLQVQNFNREQINKFIENWYQATEVMSQQLPKEDKRVRLAAHEGATNLLKRIDDNPDLTELALNPLLLTMIANVHRWRSSLPGRRVELYAEMCEVFLGKRRQATGVEEVLTPAQKQSVLQVLAYIMMQQEKREISLTNLLRVIEPSLELLPQKITGEQFVHLIRDESGILIERELQTYVFSHKTFQEYLAAVYIEKEKRLSELLDHIDRDWWHETIRLYCARNDATPIVSTCIEQSTSSLSHLVLAKQCAMEALHLEGAVRQKLDGIIEQGLDSDENERRTLAAQARLALRLSQLSRLDDTRYADSTLITHAEFQLFLDQAYIYTPDHWNKRVFPEGEARTEVVGVSALSAEAFCDWLTRNNGQNQKWRYRLPLQGELEPGYYWIKDENNYTLAQTSLLRQSFAQWMVIDSSNLTTKIPENLLWQEISFYYFHFDGIAVLLDTSFVLQKYLEEYKAYFTNNSAIGSYHFIEIHRLATNVIDVMEEYLWSKFEKRPDEKLPRIFELILDIILFRPISRILDESRISLMNDIQIQTLQRASPTVRDLIKGLANHIAEVHTLIHNFEADEKDSQQRNNNFSALSVSFNQAYQLSERICVSIENSPEIHSVGASFAHMGSILQRCIAISDILASQGSEDISFFKDLVYRCQILYRVNILIVLYDELISMGYIGSRNLSWYTDKESDDFRQWLLQRIQKHFEKRNLLRIAISEASSNQAKTPWEIEMDNLFHVYAQFVSLEKRRRGEWKAFEGIRIVRERVPDK